jgi:hypothetical protein
VIVLEAQDIVLIAVLKFVVGVFVGSAEKPSLFSILLCRCFSSSL